MALLPAGTYKAQVLESGLQKIGEKQSLAANIKFQAYEDVRNKQAVNEVVFGRFFLTEKTFESTIKTFTEAFGWDTPNLDEIGTEDCPSVFLGKDCEIAVEHETYDDKGVSKTVAKVRWLNPVGGNKGTAEQKLIKKSDVDTAMRAKLAAYRVANPTKPKLPF